MRPHEPCPFCGSERLEVRTAWGDRRFVACRRCHAAGPTIATDDEGAWGLWDRRDGEGWQSEPHQGALF